MFACKAGSKYSRWLTTNEYIMYNINSSNICLSIWKRFYGWTQVQSVRDSDGLKPCECWVMSVVNCYAAHALKRGWGLFGRGAGRGTYPSSLIWQTKLRGGTEGEETAVRTRKWRMNQQLLIGHIWAQREWRVPVWLTLNEQRAAYLQSYGTGIIGGSNSSQHFLVFNKLIIMGYKYNSSM